MAIRYKGDAPKRRIAPRVDEPLMVPPDFEIAQEVQMTEPKPALEKPEPGLIARIAAWFRSLWGRE